MSSPFFVLDAVFVSFASVSGVVASAFLEGAFLAVELEEAVVLAGAFFAPAAEEAVFLAGAFFALAAEDAVVLAGAFEDVPAAAFVTEVLVVVFFLACEVVFFADELVFVAVVERADAVFVAGAFFALVDPEVVAEVFAVVEVDFFAVLGEAFVPAVEVVFFVEDVVEDAADLAVDAFFAVVFVAVFVPVAVVFFSAVDTNTLSLSTGSPNISSTAVTIQVMNLFPGTWPGNKLR